MCAGEGKRTLCRRGKKKRSLESRIFIKMSEKIDAEKGQWRVELGGRKNKLNARQSCLNGTACLKEHTVMGTCEAGPRWGKRPSHRTDCSKARETALKGNEHRNRSG